MSKEKISESGREKKDAGGSVFEVWVCEEVFGWWVKGSGLEDVFGPWGEGNGPGEILSWKREEAACVWSKFLISWAETFMACIGASARNSTR